MKKYKLNKSRQTQYAVWGMRARSVSAWLSYLLGLPYNCYNNIGHRTNYCTCVLNHYKLTYAARVQICYIVLRQKFHSDLWMPSDITSARNWQDSTVVKETSCRLRDAAVKQELLKEILIHNIFLLYLLT